MSKNISPGEELFQWLLNRYKRQRVNQDSWINFISANFNIIELEDFLMRSTVLMVLRRLLWNASWYKIQYIEEDIIQDKFEKEYLLAILGFEPIERRQLSRLVFKALEVSRKNIPPRLFNQLKEKAHQVNQKCTIGGCDIDYFSENSHSSFSLDHIWPQSLGGPSEEWNLRITCRDCNSLRQNLIEASDAHYEHFHVKTNWSPNLTDSFWQELNKNFRIAVLLRADFRCEICGDPVENMEDGLDFLKKEHFENYHMFNIQAACGKHRR